MLRWSIRWAGLGMATSAWCCKGCAGCFGAWNPDDKERSWGGSPFLPVLRVARFARITHVKPRRRLAWRSRWWTSRAEARGKESPPTGGLTGGSPGVGTCGIPFLCSFFFLVVTPFPNRVAFCSPWPQVWEGGKPRKDGPDARGVASRS